MRELLLNYWEYVLWALLVLALGNLFFAIRATIRNR